MFVKFQCSSCHAVMGETFRPPDPGGGVGPGLSAPAAHDPPEFFAESIIDPRAVIGEGRGYKAPGGTSGMPTFSEDATVSELIDLAAYLVSLRPPGAIPAPAATHPASGSYEPH